MNVQEMSNQFDVYLDSYRRFKDFDKKEELDSIEFDEYEKSVFLTKAQEEIILGLYNGHNAYGDSYETTEELRRYLDKLVKSADIEPTGEDVPIEISSSSYFFLLPLDLWFIIYETAKVSSTDCKNGELLDVIPVNHDEYNRIKRNPFRGTSGRRVLRLDPGYGVVEIVSKYTITNYIIRYLTKPDPIILEDLPNDLSINGVSIQQGCKLHEGLHERLVQEAVRLALTSKNIATKDN